MKQLGRNKQYSPPDTYLVVFFKPERPYPVIERRTRDEILELRRTHDFKSMAVIEGDVIKSFGADVWGGIQ